MEKKVKAKRNKKAVSVHVRLSYVSAENLGEVIEPGNAKNFWPKLLQKWPNVKHNVDNVCQKKKIIFLIIYELIYF